MTAAMRREPTRDQLLAMAYVDGELSESARRECEDRLYREPELMRAIAEQERIVQLVDQIIVSAGLVSFERMGFRAS